tara:strand:- start:508 stop:828 length:321 start_codon:yes stop_codon:yes gene_type:complete
MANEAKIIYDVFFVGHAYKNDTMAGTNWVQAGTGFPTDDGSGINIQWETSLPEEIREVVVNANGDTIHRLLPVKVCVKQRQPKQAVAKTSKKAPAKKAESSNAIPF